MSVFHATGTAQECKTQLDALMHLEAEVARLKSHGRRGVWMVLSSLGLGFVALVFLDQPFLRAATGLFALSVVLFLVVVVGRRRSLIGTIASALFVLFVLLLSLANVLVPSPLALLAALDLQAAPVEVLSAVTLSVLGTAGLVLWRSGRSASTVGTFNESAVRYADSVAIPLLADAALDQRGTVALSPLLPDAAAWTVERGPQLELRSLTRPLCAVRVPLEREELFVAQIVESVVARTVHRRNPRGKLKIKPKGHRISLRATIFWSLNTPLAGGADLSQQLRQHLTETRTPLPHGVDLRARCTPDRIEITLHQKLRNTQRIYGGSSGFPPALVHQCAQFLAKIRAQIP